MTRQIIARKYRPGSFGEVVGQEHVVRTLRNAIIKGKIADGYLLSGPRGVGKTSIARIFAKCLNCQAGPSPDPCGSCPECVGITSGTSIDVREIDGASNNGIDQVRSIRESIRLGPSRGKYRIYIIDEVHMLSQGAFGALQKTVEEPPPHAKFIFATTEAERLPATFSSRCQRLELRALGDREVAAHLLSIAKAEGVVLGEDAALVIARGARGGMRDAESMLDQAIASFGGRVEGGGVGDIFGMPRAEEVYGVISDMIDGKLGDALSKISNLAASGKDLAGFGEAVKEAAGELLVAEAGGGTGSVWGEHFLAPMKGRIPVELLGRFVTEIGEGLGGLHLSNDKKSTLEGSVIHGFHVLHTATVDEVLSALGDISSGKGISGAGDK